MLVFRKILHTYHTNDPNGQWVVESWLISSLHKNQSIFISKGACTKYRYGIFLS